MRRPATIMVAVGMVAVASCASAGVRQGASEAVTVPPSTPPSSTPSSAPSTRATPSSTPSGAPLGADPFGWSQEVGGLQRGALHVPLDYSDPAKGTITLSVVRHVAANRAQRIGSLLVNPGGPGAGGTVLAEQAAGIYSPNLLDRFDIVAWDPRGTGASDPHVDCIDRYDPFFGIDSSPDTEQERNALIAMAKEFAADCAKRSGALLSYVSTASSARDIDAIRQALGEPKISYFGFSYGSELGATWATLFPSTVRAVVIDGAVDPSLGYLEQNVHQAKGFEAAFDTFLARCSASSGCPFNNGGDAAGAYDALAASIDAHPLTVSSGRTPVTQGVLEAAVTDAMYLESSWPDLEQALADAQKGDGHGLLALYDHSYMIDDSATGRATDNLTEAYFAIGCLDDPGSTSPAELYTHLPEFVAAAPRLGAGWMAELTFCAVWPVPQAADVTITGKGAGTIVVVGTTGDPATPLADTRKMAAALEGGRLIVVTGNQHTGYGLNQCIDDAVGNYLVDPAGKVPAVGATC